jgi:AraC-like DNA-binding protein
MKNWSRGPNCGPWLRRVWRYESSGEDRRVQRIAPDGCPELIVHLGAPYEEVGPDGLRSPQPAIVFAGQLTRPLALRATGPVKVVAVRFEPDAARGWLNRPLTAATDARLDLLASGPPRRRHDRGPAPPVAVRRVGGLQGLLAESRHDPRWTLDPEVRAAVVRIEAGEPDAPESAAGRRNLQRKFLNFVGVSGRTLRSVVRFRRVFARLREPDGEEWLSSALRAGYFDQPQMARDFRRFLGCTATEWAAEQQGLAHQIASQTYKTEEAASV